MQAVLIPAILLFLMGCGSLSGKVPGSAKKPAPDTAKGEKAAALTISAAASLKDAMEEIKQAYAKEKPNVTLTFNYGASGSLQQQIEQGAPADIFLSAGTKQMEGLAAKGLIIEETKRNLLENQLVLITSKNLQISVDFKGLADDRIKMIGIGEPGSVPSGQYAEEVFTNLGIMEKVKTKEMFARDVREVLTWVETGNIDVGIVYETDARVADKVKILARAPENLHSPIVYPAAVIKSSRNTDAAKAFLDFISQDKGKVIFERYGFAIPGN